MGLRFRRSITWVDIIGVQDDWSQINPFPGCWIRTDLLHVTAMPAARP